MTTKPESLREQQAVSFRLRILEAMEGEGAMPGLEWIEHQFGATRIPVSNYSPEALAAAEAFLKALPSVHEAMLSAYKAVADFGLAALGEACEVIADLQNDAQDQIERENGLQAAEPQEVA
ncbi:MAG: hypothetical protein KQJ78_19575 [Deltaproteobacteria bacterium]|nr:hypothetical protein [Deltaproteobacteria bacterium]